MQCVYTTLFGGIVACRTSRINSTALSQCEYEWFGATLGASILQAMEPVMQFLMIKYQLPFLLFCDNKAACMLSDSNHSSRRMKHVATRLAHLQDGVREGHVKTDANLADLGTKPLSARPFHNLASYLWSN